eukprot:TRINITY_DN2941_c0_g1_i3.p1 TRINITY_DN2941_c0_g1~~TRINITY_DN2941_c0_g1_i3.p1  ORF type:complete len:50 (+),score=4.64 TRINITY_DN2941_c0_g1_i3:93-242(+)
MCMEARDAARLTPAGEMSSQLSVDRCTYVLLAHGARCAPWAVELCTQQQ